MIKGYVCAIRFLSRFIKPYRIHFIIFYFGWLFETVLSVSMPMLFGIMIDQIVYYHNLDTFLQISIIYFFLIIYSCILYFLLYAQHHYIMNRFTYDIRHELFLHIQCCKAEVLSGKASGQILTILQKYPQECMFFLIRDVMHMINKVLTVLFVSAELLILNRWMGLLIFITVPIAVIINTRFGKKVRTTASRERQIHEDYIGWLFEMMPFINNLGLIGATKRADKRFVGFQRSLFQLKNHKSFTALTSDRGVVFVNLFIQLLIFVFAGSMANKGSLSFGGLTVIIAFYGILKEKIRSISSEYLHTQERIVYIQKIEEMLNKPTEEKWLEGLINEIKNGRIDFRHVTFSYESGNKVLKDLNLSIEPNERLAIAGESGAGKTTLIDLLLGFYPSDEGVILIDGENISKYSLYSLRNSIGVVRQQILVFEGTIADNLRLGKKNASKEEMIFALSRAGLWDMVEKLPEGLDTIIGSRGRDLSGGERQRLAIARIYLKNPIIIIFDEATSSLDEATEKEILKAWDQLLSGRTTIVVSHRQSAVMLCDRVVILKDGKIAESGNPLELEAESSLFRNLFAVKDTTK